MRAITCIFVLFIGLLGCSQRTQLELPPRKPPQFNLGDEVSPTNSSQVGVVVFFWKEEKTDEWHYEVMFQSGKINYTEKQLELVEKHIWRNDGKIDPKAELDSEEFSEP